MVVVFTSWISSAWKVFWKRVWWFKVKEDTPNLAEDWFSYLSGLHNSQNATMFTHGKVPIIILLSTNDAAFKDSLWL